MGVNKVLRLGVILFIIGLALGVSAIPRSDKQVTGGIPTPLIPPHQKAIIRFFFPPRDIRLEVESSSPINFYLFDKKGFEAYNKSRNFNPIFYFKNESKGMYFVSLSKRGIYFMVFQNLSNETVFVKVTVFFYGFEKDIIQASMVFLFLGPTILVLSIINVTRYLSNTYIKIRRRMCRNRIFNRIT